MQPRSHQSTMSERHNYRHWTPGMFWSALLLIILLGLAVWGAIDYGQSIDYAFGHLFTHE
jgi:hypothetical protein